MNDPLTSFRSMRQKIRKDILRGLLFVTGGGFYGGMMLYHVMSTWEFDIPLFFIAATGVVAITAAMIAASFCFQDAINVHRNLIRCEREADEIHEESYLNHVGIRAENI